MAAHRFNKMAPTQQNGTDSTKWHRFNKMAPIQQNGTDSTANSSFQHVFQEKN
jgi:hypothetical protein